VHSFSNMNSRGGVSCVLRWCVITAVILGHNTAEGFEEAVLTTILKEAPEIVTKILYMWDQLGKTATGVFWFNFIYSQNSSV
jgi:hypothetical protein